MNRPPQQPTPPIIDPWAEDDGLGGDPQAAWRERERRQRSVRFLMMFLLMLLLMDGEEQSNNRKRDPHFRHSHLRKRSRYGGAYVLEQDVFDKRQAQDSVIRNAVKSDVRYKKLLEKNNGIDYGTEVLKWAEQQIELEKDEFVEDKDAEKNANQNVEDPEEITKVMHYPWNVTGFYRGEWVREDFAMNIDKTIQTNSNSDNIKNNNDNENKDNVDGNDADTVKEMTLIELEQPMMDILKQRKESIGIYVLPEGLEMKLPANYTTIDKDDEFKSTTTTNNLSPYPQTHPFLRVGVDYNTVSSTTHGSSSSSSSSNNNDNKNGSDGESQVTLTKSSGRAAFQLYSRSVPAIQELSILDGFVKLYDSNTVGYSTRRDILLRVSGVLVHSIGKMSLVANVAPDRSAFVIADKSEAMNSAHRRLRDTIAAFQSSDTIDMEKIRNDALALFTPPHNDEQPVIDWSLSSPDSLVIDNKIIADHRRLDDVNSIGAQDTNVVSEQQLAAIDNSISITTHDEYIFSNYVFPHPYVPDDEDQSIRKAKTQAARKMPPREQLLEANVGKCEFEINMDVKEEEWTVGEWRKLVIRHVNEALQLNPALHPNTDKDTTEGADSGSANKTPNKPSAAHILPRRKPIQDEALVMTMLGSIDSPNCNFTAMLNATAIRTDWEHTTGKAINYSFYMMLTCLTQIVVLLRQLLHTQAQSAATRVSLLCIGWQTVLDALLCLVHIYLSLAMQPLFTAFASVAFFKLLIFCVIEMKYMAIIIQARNSNNGGNTVELLRRQIAMLHLRFYVALIGSFLAFFYAGDAYRTVYVLALYSFWVPQIVQNIITEAKRPMHHYYIYGMSVTRLVAPIYIFAVPNNFLKEVYPDSPTNVFMCELLIVWVGIQTAVLVAQGRYGARFMIPARFLPPKFDYNRPIPPSLLPPGALEPPPSELLQSERGSPERQGLVSRGETTNTPPLDHRTTGTTRNRIKGSKVNRSESGMTTETVNTPPPPPAPSIDCVICYNAIDVRNRRGYMLAPCDHLFHKDCLVQWMDVKMECPICRTELPAL